MLNSDPSFHDQRHTSQPSDFAPLIKAPLEKTLEARFGLLELVYNPFLLRVLVCVSSAIHQDQKIGDVSFKVDLLVPFFRTLLEGALETADEHYVIKSDG